MEIVPTKLLRKFVNGHTVEGFNFDVKVGEEPNKGVGSREYFGKVIHKVITLVRRRHDCDGRNRSSIGSHKPDYTARSEEFAGEQGIVSIGEIKGIVDADREFSDEEVGQILDFLQELLTKQGWRQWVFGFLTDGVRFEFFRGMRRRDDDLISFTRSGLLSKGAGWLRLSQLLQQTDEILGFSVITVAGWNLGSWLGSGATTSVFAATSSDAGQIAVCKIFKGSGPNATACRNNECRALQLMSGDPHTPKIASNVDWTGGEQSFPVLVVTPLGESLGANGVRLPIHAYSPLVDTLRAAHQLSLCHIDVCGDNMFAVRKINGEGYDVFLNDWASSMLTGEVAAAAKFYTHELYYDVTRMGPTEDLAALVRSVFVLTQCTFPSVQTAEELDVHMRLQWSWGVALDSARDGSYDAVRQFFLTGSCDSSDELANALAEKLRLRCHG